MRIIIDILHPAHVHFFRNFIKKMRQRGHEILITARKKDVALDLLKEYNLNCIPLSELKKGKINLLKEFFSRTYKLYKITKQFKPDVLVGVMGPSISVVGKLLGIPCVIFYNNENAGKTNFFAYPLATAVCTSSSYNKKVNGRHVTYQGYHEFAYLHPDYYVPKKKVLENLGIDKEKYVLVRFVSWQASHDVGEKGLNNKLAIVRELERYAKVYVTSEAGIPKLLEKNILKIKHKKDIFDVEAGAALIFGEGATMASEAAMLGVPAVYVNSLQLGYLKELERDYKMVYNFKKEGPGLRKAIELLNTKNIKNIFNGRRQEMLRDKIDVTRWMIQFIENLRLKEKQTYVNIPK